MPAMATIACRSCRSIGLPASMPFQYKPCWHKSCIFVNETLLALLIVLATSSAALFRCTLFTFLSISPHS
jgi:hypothetical protein